MRLPSHTSKNHIYWHAGSCDMPARPFFKSGVYRSCVDGVEGTEEVDG